MNFGKIASSLIVAGVLALVGFASRMDGRIDGVQKDLAAEIKNNRAVTCMMAQRLQIFIPQCAPQALDER